MSEDNDEQKITYQDFFNIKLNKFYEFVTEVMHDFTFTVHRSIKDEEGKRRIELWRSSKSEESAMVWIEIARNGEDIDRYVSSDVLRTMNEEGLTKLFFFTNSNLDEDTRDILDGKNHYIFTPADIIETLEALDMKRITVKPVKKRKTVKIASGFFQIRNYLKQNPPKGKKVFVNTSTLSDMCDHYVVMTRQILNDVDRVDDINNMSPELKDRFKRVQTKLLPELRKTLFYKFTDRFDYLAQSIYNIQESLIIYIGALVEMESEEELNNCREKIEKELNVLKEIDGKLEEFYKEQMDKAESLSYRLLYTSIGIIVFMAVFFGIMMLKK
ncbi:hypothetical protein [Seleniivibrio sp.]|uniref:hypothetical protein n=1 Tax=Seleniivibrio sp. TaxID=2898801 RepID=UPI0025E550A9|nr:hypothetical protein [Seleniivibrio sp.]MCD8553907.1 hypothetical protein [Seleniivibrio sp.]